MRLNSLEPLDFVQGARRMIRGFTWHGTYAEACSLVMGYDVGRAGRFLDGFQAWLGERFGRPEVAFFVHVLKDALPDASDPKGRCLTDEENGIAVKHLFDLLEEYVNEQRALNPLLNDRHFM